MNYKLYGDGLHDDTLAIQELIRKNSRILVTSVMS